jgi:hypothetical protein
VDIDELVGSLELVGWGPDALDTVETVGGSMVSMKNLENRLKGQKIDLQR